MWKCIRRGGVSVDPNKQCSHLFLMHNTEGAEKAWFKYYQEKILIHKISLQQKRYCNFNIVEGASIPDKATAVAWCDGGLYQIDTIMISVELYAGNKIIANKQNAAQSSVKQPADLTHVFKIISKNQHTHT
jgi:hypothetical protein